MSSQGKKLRTKYEKNATTFQSQNEIIDKYFVGKEGIQSVTPNNASFLRWVAMFDLNFLSLFSQEWGVLCSLEMKKPESSKTYPTFVFSSLLMPFMAY